MVIRQALLFQRSYLFLFFASAVLTAGLGLAALRRSHAARGWSATRSPGRASTASAGTSWAACRSDWGRLAPGVSCPPLALVA